MSADKPIGKPRVGDLVDVRGVKCVVVKLRPFGTIDVAELHGTRAWRISGLYCGPDDADSKIEVLS